jgi:hypothetical protein
MRYYSLISLSIIISIVWNSCKIVKSTISPSNEKSVDSIGIADDLIKICAKNLSEDMSLLATQNDEIILLLFPHSSASVPTKGLIVSKIFTKDNNCYISKLDSTTVGSLTLVLLEQDSDATLTVIDSVVRNNIDSLTAYYRKSDYTKIRSVLGDDDVLGIRNIWVGDSAFTTSIIGFHKMDKYEYSISFGRHED